MNGVDLTPEENWLLLSFDSDLIHKSEENNFFKTVDSYEKEQID